MREPSHGDPRIVRAATSRPRRSTSRVQAAILNLLADLQNSKQDVSYIFISHDLGVVRYLSDRIAVLYLGRIMEIGPSEQKSSAGPHHPYTEALLSAVPKLDGKQTETARIRLDGEIPSATNPPIRLRLPHTLPAQDRPDLRAAGAAAGRGAARPLDPLPHPLAELARLQKAAVIERRAASASAGRLPQAGHAQGTVAFRKTLIAGPALG